MKREDTCWNVSVWETAKESGPANLLVSQKHACLIHVGVCG